MPFVTSIQKYSIHDGDGIRTTVFFKGCPLSCAWCHNPETQSYQSQLMHDGERCVSCGKCHLACPNEAVNLADGKMVTDLKKCIRCGSCIDACVLNLREIMGKEYSVEELVIQVKKDEMFYEQSGGGVTLSGGEVMTQDMNDIETLVKELNRIGISVAIDTCGYAPYENFRKIMPYVDTFLYDIKAMDPAIHKKYMGTDNGLILENLKKLSEDGGRIFIRIPVIKEVNGTDEQMQEVIRFLLDEHIRVAQVNLLPYHNTGSGKYKRMGATYPGEKLHAPETHEMEQFQALFKEAGFHNTKIGG